jgi:hypothetical protein
MILLRGHSVSFRPIAFAARRSWSVGAQFGSKDSFKRAAIHGAARYGAGSPRVAWKRNGSDWVAPKFEAAGIELATAKTRAFNDLKEAVREAEAGAYIIPAEMLATTAASSARSCSMRSRASWSCIARDSPQPTRRPRYLWFASRGTRPGPRWRRSCPQRICARAITAFIANSRKSLHDTPSSCQSI